jgi:hypothetical protein
MFSGLGERPCSGATEKAYRLLVVKKMSDEFRSNERQHRGLLERHRTKRFCNPAVATLAISRGLHSTEPGRFTYCGADGQNTYTSHLFPPVECKVVVGETGNIF